MIEQIGGEGTIEKRIPAMLRMYLNYDIDMRKSPILVYPTLHYQNGGLEIGGDGSEPSGPTTLSRGVRFRSPPSESHDARNAHTIANMVSSFFIVR